MRPDPLLDRAQGGLGIGLAIVKRLVEMHGGRVSAESPGLGLGSTFTVRLPLAPSAAPLPSEAPLSSQPATASGMPVLIVDDNVDAGDSLAALIGSLGHEARVARSGEKALALARGWVPAIAFLDIGMPGLNGYETAQRFRRDDALSSVTLVALTGWGTQDDKRKSTEAGLTAT